MKLLLLAGLILAMGAAGANAQPDAIARGRALVEGNCGGCHAVGAQGDSPMPQAPHFRDLSARYPIEDLAEALSEGLIVGHRQMPELSFEPGQVRDIIAYLKSIQPDSPAAVSR